MLLSQSLRILGGGIALAALVTAVTVGVAAAAVAHRAPPRAANRAAPVSELRALADHYRVLTWEYERAARTRRTPSSFSYRRSVDRPYLRWTIDVWTRRAYVARERALSALHRKLAVRLPHAPALRSSLGHRVAYSRRLTLRLRRIYPGRVTRGFAAATAATTRATLRLWQQRSAAATIGVAEHAAQATPSAPAWLTQAFLCIHAHEGGWSSNTGNGYYGGLQMDWGFMRSYGPDFLDRWGTADAWPVWAQIAAAVRAYDSGRGFSPWPNTARACGLA